MGIIEDSEQFDRETLHMLRNVRTAQLTDAANPTLQHSYQLRGALNAARNAVDDELRHLNQVREHIMSLIRETDLQTAERKQRETGGCAGCGPSPAAQAGPPTYAPYRRPPLPSRVLGQIPFYPRKPTSICPSCFRQFVLTGYRPGGLCDACVMRRQTWAAPPRAPPEFWNPGNIGRRY